MIAPFSIHANLVPSGDHAMLPISRWLLALNRDASELSAKTVARVMPRIAGPLMDNLARTDGICIGDNEPYSGRHPHDFTIDHHAEPAGRPHVGIEVRQDLVSNDRGAAKWAGILAAALRPILADPGLFERLQDEGPGGGESLEARAKA